jgi:hypothetical protein
MSTGDVDPATIASITLSKRAMKNPKPFGVPGVIKLYHFNQSLPPKPWNLTDDGSYSKKVYLGGKVIHEKYTGSLDQKGRTTGHGVYEQFSKKGRPILRYEGVSRGDKFHGQGKLTKWPDKDDPSATVTYIGAWQSGDYHGYGVLTYPDGTRHAGAFRSGQIHGFGDRRYPAGAESLRRRGAFAPARPRPRGRRRAAAAAAEEEEDPEDVVQTGPGEVWFPNGDHGAGTFKRHDLDGPGVYTYGPGGRALAEYEGGLRGGVSDGLGRLLYRGGGACAGEFAEDEPHGAGVLRRADGRVFRGRFAAGAQAAAAPTFFFIV